LLERNDFCAFAILDPVFNKKLNYIIYHHQQYYIILRIGTITKIKKKKKKKKIRANITPRKYKKKLECRHDKVWQLLVRGYTQSEISMVFQIGQLTISRDIYN